jgi:UDP-N-acetylmuramoyl-tripeptide--D-alanyl-D-alanine ligase
MLTGGVVAACAVAAALAGIRWLRVAQREHYLADATSRFALRWWLRVPENAVALVLAALGVVLCTRWPATGFLTAAVVAAGPFGLGLRGRTSPLAWTRRLRTLAAVWAVLQAVAVVVGVLAGVGPVVAASAALAVPAIIDAALAVTAPVEHRVAGRYVKQAATRLRRVGPRVVAITGSYGKTTTKGYVAHLLGETLAVVASPASFNNRAGLSRTVNEHLAEGTDVFVAEMGTYGRGEIAALCRWIPPDVSVITAIGPVHLERFHTEDAIVEAKSEILDKASAAVLVVDDPRLGAVADQAALRGTVVWRVSAVDRQADVCVEQVSGALRVWIRGEKLTDVTVDARPTNVACAVAVALQLGVEPEVVSRLLPSLPTAPHRLEPAPTAAGRCLVLDDTYNSNPAGARAALDAMVRLAPPAGRRVVVTPGMVELGRRQATENAAFAAAAGEVATDVVVVGRTNRRALLRGLADTETDVVVLATRDEAVTWVRENLGDGDVALFENDLPDHYP